MEIGVSIAGKIVVDSQVNTFNIDTTSENISSNADTLVEFLELLVTLDTVDLLVWTLCSCKLCYIPFILTDAGVDSNRREVAFTQELVKLGSSECALNKDDDLVEGCVIEQLVESAVLLLLIKLDVELLETVEGKLRLVVNVDFEWVLHELLADRSDLL